MNAVRTGRSGAAKSPKNWPSQQTWLITGAGSGIGRELAKQLGSLGANLALADWDGESLAATVEMCSNVVGSANFDIVDREQFREFVADIGQVDGIINNAGIGMIMNATTMQRRDFERMININFWGVVNGVDAVLPQMIERGSGQIVNLSSVYGLLGWPNNTAYCAAKSAVRGYSESLRQDLASKGISVSCVFPGGVRTNIVATAQRDGNTSSADPALAKRFESAAKTTPKQAAATIIKGVRRQQPRILIGADARWLDRLQRYWPNHAGAIVSRVNERIA